MAFEKEIKQATKLADEWMTRSQGDEQFFIDVKKENVKWEKDYIKLIEADIAKGDMDAALDKIESSRSILADIKVQCESRYKKHAEFVRGAPRKGSVGICDELKLKSGTDVFKAVNEAMSKMLIAHTKQFKQTENAWNEDLLPRITLLYSRLDTLEKLASGQEKEMTAYGKQFQKDADAYKAQMEHTLVELKPSMAETTIKNISANKDTWCGGDPKIQLDQLRVLRARIELCDKVLAISEKNYNRVLKSVPDNVKNKLMFARPLKSFEILHKKIQTEVKSAQGAFKTAVAVVEKNFPKLG